MNLLFADPKLVAEVAGKMQSVCGPSSSAFQWILIRIYKIKDQTWTLHILIGWWNRYLWESLWILILNVTDWWHLMTIILSCAIMYYNIYRPTKMMPKSLVWKWHPKFWVIAIVWGKILQHNQLVIFWKINYHCEYITPGKVEPLGGSSIPLHRVPSEFSP